MALIFQALLPIESEVKVNEASLNQAAAPQLNKTAHAEPVEAGGPKKPGESQRGAESDQAQISDLSGRLLQVLNAESPQRAARLESLSAEYRAGKYQVDAAAVSRRLVDDALTNGR